MAAFTYVLGLYILYGLISGASSQRGDDTRYGDKTVSPGIAYEATGYVVVTVRLDAPSASGLTFKYSTVPSGAASIDFEQFNSVPISIPQGRDHVNFTIGIADDSVPEADEKFKLRLTDFSDSSGAFNHFIYIADNDDINICTGERSFRENDSLARVRLSRPSAKSVGILKAFVSTRTLPDQAKENEDFIPITNDTVVFASNERFKDIEIPLIDNFEHHLQRALSAQQVYGTSEALVIPIPEVEDIAEKYDQYYKQDFKLGKQYIHIQAFGMDQEIPDYDMDSEDEGWLNEQAKKMEITPLKFEEMMDRLEKGSGQQVVTLQEAKLLLKEDDDLIIAVYDYWLNKRLRTQQPLIATVKTEKRDGSTTNNPYVAFRRRTEKMQTRKNRKNDEVSYEKMLKLRRDLSRAVTLLEVIKRREKSKKELLQLTIEVLEKRYQSEDFDGKLLAHAEAERHKHPSFIPPFSLSKSGEWVQGVNGDIAPKPKKRAYRKRKQSQQQQHHHHHNHHHQTSNITSHYSEVDILHPDIDSSDDDGLSPGMSPSDHEDENDPDGPFAFKRRKHCHYFTPLMGRQGNWSWCSPDEGGLGDKKYRYSLMSLPPPRNCVGFSRRRVGRGGRVIMDRAYTPWDDGLDRLDLGDPSHSPEVLGEYVTYIRERKIPHFRPKTPPPDSDSRHGSRSPSSTPVSVEFNFETFQSHKEQLLEMKREQEEKLLQLEASEIDSSVILGQSFSSQPTSRFTLDSASAEFAVSAVMNSSQLPSANIGATTTTTTTTTTSTSSSSSNNLTAPSVSLPPVSTSPSSLLSASLTAPPILVTTQTTTPTPPTVAVTTNGPLIDSKTSGLSTSPAANILQLNFPLNVCSVTTAAVTTALTAATSVKVSSASTFMKPTVNNKVMPANTSTFKLSTTPATALNLLKQNHEDHNAVSTFNKDQVLPMDVT